MLPIIDASASTKVDIPEFYASYGGNSQNSYVSGFFVEDDVTISGTTVRALDFAVVDAGQGPRTGGGIMGMGFDGLEATAQNASEQAVYPTVLDTMYNEGIINSHTFSLYLDDLAAGSGALLFGGYDTDKYVGDLVSFNGEGTAEYPVFAVGFSYLSITDPSGSTTHPLTADPPLAVILDSGTPISALPDSVFTAVANHIISLGYAITAADSSNVLYTVDCSLASASGSLNLGFEDPTSGNSLIVDVPFSELAVLAEGEGSSCLFGISPQVSGNPLIFGDTFMRSMYIVYGLDYNVISIAPSSFNSGSSNIVPI